VKDLAKEITLVQLEKNKYSCLYACHDVGWCEKKIGLDTRGRVG
jgi:hypothetical protein